MTVLPATQARQVARPVVVLLTVLAAVLFAVGWLAGKVSLPFNWMFAAVRVGWDDARHEAGIG